MKLHPSEQNSVTDIFKSKCPPDVILEVKVQKCSYLTTVIISRPEFKEKIMAKLNLGI